MDSYHSFTQMSPDSEFPRIVLLNDCVEDVRAMLGIYTHIQSYNGIFLDGMDINEVTSIFQSMRSPIAYLMIRYLCPIQGATPAQQRMVTPIYKPEAPRLDPTSGEELPIPLYILGDNYRLCKMLFDLLKEGEFLHHHNYMLALYPGSRYEATCIYERRF